MALGCTIDKRVKGLETRDDVISRRINKIWWKLESLWFLKQSIKALVYTLTGTVPCFSLLDTATAWLETQNSGFWPVKGSKHKSTVLMRLFRQKLTVAIGCTWAFPIPLTRMYTTKNRCMQLFNIRILNLFNFWRTFFKIKPNCSNSSYYMLDMQRQRDLGRKSIQHVFV